MKSLRNVLFYYLELSLNEEDDNAEPKPTLIHINACQRKIPTTNASSKQNKSATVDLGMLGRTSSSPEIDLPVKEKRGKTAVAAGEGSRAGATPNDNSRKLR